MMISDIDSWGTFKIGELFKIRRGRRIVKQEDYFDEKSSEYCYPVITAKTMNNGVDGYYCDYNCKGNTIISCGEANGMYTTYQAKPCWIMDTARIYTFKDNSFPMNRQIGLFLSAVLSSNMYRFSYGRKAKPDNMYDIEIKLPVDMNGKPDWDYMHTYIRGIEGESMNQLKVTVFN